MLEWENSLRGPGLLTVREKAEAQTFETEFLNIFGVDRKKVALFEHEVHFGDNQNTLFEDTAGEGKRGYIDLFWKGKIIIEMKTPGKDLDKAYEQAKAYALSLPQKEIPKGILTSDFLNFQYYNLEDNAKCYSFRLDELPAYVDLFGYLAGYKEIDPYKNWDPVNIPAAEKMGKLHDRLKESGYTGHQLELYLVRLLFCLFADDTGIFEPPDIFIKYILVRTAEDGSDLALHLQKIFEVLNKPKENRLKTIDEQLNQFPYINGHLFEETIETADFDRPMRDTLIDCCRLDWSKISPAIFGAMFQSVMNDDERHDLGAHYTSEENILKLIHPLFLDGLWDEFNKIITLSPSAQQTRLIEFHNRIANLKFLDPACGCGNFLVISYRELRLLELEILERLLGNNQVLDVSTEIKVNVDQFFGLEIEEFPSQIAQVAMWLTDHQMNMRFRERFGQYFARIPLVSTASIHCVNSLTTDWESIVAKSELSYILGNPPFLGSRIMNREQKSEVEHIFDGMKNFGDLDYVTCWYLKAAKYIQNTNIEVAFVSTNSICQGLQTTILWPKLLNEHGIKINFAHQTFKWSNEAKGKAAVFCIIVGFSLSERKEKRLYHYATVISEPVASNVNRINAYLIDAENIFIQARSEPLCNVPGMKFGSMAADGGQLLFTTNEKNEFLKKEPNALPYFRRFIGSEEFINNKERWCLWLVDIEPNELKKLKSVLQRVNNVKEIRSKSARPFLAEIPHLFAQIAQPKTGDYIVVPKVSSERRKYIPMGIVSSDIIASDLVFIIPNATIYDLGILMSEMHMVWMRYVCGRLEMRYRYSKDIVYNNFPWPVPTDKQVTAIEEKAQQILGIRSEFPNSSLADLYDPLTMPPKLIKAHHALDSAAEKAYGKTFEDDAGRVAYLFELYQKMSGELFTETGKKRRNGRKLYGSKRYE